MLTEPELRTHAYYEGRARQGEMDDDLPWHGQFVFEAFSKLPNQAKMLDIGCGNGRLIYTLPFFGLHGEHYTGVDPSRAQLDLAELLHPGYTFQVGSIYDVGERYPETFDAIWCCFVLMHIPRERLDEALASLRRAAKPGAVGIVQTMDGDGEVVFDGLTLTRHNSCELGSAFRRAGFDPFLFIPEERMLAGSFRAI